MIYNDEQIKSMATTLRTLVADNKYAYFEEPLDEKTVDQDLPEGVSHFGSYEHAYKALCQDLVIEHTRVPEILEDLRNDQRRLARVVVQQGQKINAAAESWNASMQQHAEDVGEGSPVDTLLGIVAKALHSAGGEASDVEESREEVTKWLEAFGEKRRWEGAMGAATGFSIDLRSTIQEEGLTVGDCFKIAEDPDGRKTDEQLADMPEETPEQKLRKMEAQRNSFAERVGRLTLYVEELQPLLMAAHNELSKRARSKPRLSMLVNKMAKVLGLQKGRPN